MPAPQVPEIHRDQRVAESFGAMGGSFTMPYTTVAVTAKTGQPA
jgi:hypothetical protein